MNKLMQECVIMTETDQTNSLGIYRFRFMQISADSVESQPSTLVRTDSIPCLDSPGVSCRGKLLCFGKRGGGRNRKG